MMVRRLGLVLVLLCGCSLLGCTVTPYYGRGGYYNRGYGRGPYYSGWGGYGGTVIIDRPIGGHPIDPDYGVNPDFDRPVAVPMPEPDMGMPDMGMPDMGDMGGMGDFGDFGGFD
jgi:hypothetical protein